MPIKTNLTDFLCSVDEYRNEYNPARVNDCYVNAYEHGKSYGGPEEGGWWYDYYEPLSSLRVNTVGQAMIVFELFHDIHAGYYEDGPGISSVGHRGDFVILVEPHEARHMPQNRPHYE